MTIVNVLLATYNGEKFLQAQIESIINQTYSDWKIFARDDCSKDRTVDILREYAATYPDQFYLIDNSDGNLGFVQNFSRLLEVVESGYFMFCDQDDIWMPNKLEYFVGRMLEIERDSGQKTPILLHSYYETIDRAGNLLFVKDNASLKYRKNIHIKKIAIKNVATGCVSMGNFALCERIRPIPAAIRYHDWWAAMVASVSGHIEFLPQATIYYRQHDESLVGARRRKTDIMNWLTHPHWKISQINRNMVKQQNQTQALLERFFYKIPDKDREFLEFYVGKDLNLRRVIFKIYIYLFLL